MRTRSVDVQQNNHSNKTIKKPARTKKLRCSRKQPVEQNQAKTIENSDVQQKNHSNKTKQKPSRTHMLNNNKMRTKQSSDVQQNHRSNKPSKNHRELKSSDSKDNSEITRGNQSMNNLFLKISDTKRDCPDVIWNTRKVIQYCVLLIHCYR